MVPEHRISGDRVTIFISDADIFRNTKHFKNHRLYVAHVFKQLGIEITQFHTTARDSGIVKGLEFMRTDSEIDPRLEVTATLGVNARRIIGAA